MTFLLFSSQFSRAGLLAIADRYSSFERVEEWLSSDDPNQRLPGDFEVVTDWTWDGGPVDTLSILWLLGLGQTGDSAVFLSGTETVYVPAPGDLDAQGRCRCGCGYVQPAEAA